MPIQKDVIKIPLGGKLDESINPQVLSSGSMVVADNVRYKKHGNVEKFNGNELVSMSIDSSGDRIDAHSLLANEDCLIVGGSVEDSAGKSMLDEHYQCLARGEVDDVWYKRGGWSPIRQSKRHLNYSDESIFSVETVINAGYIYSAVVYLEPVTATPRNYKIRLTIIEAASGNVMLDGYELPSGKTAPRLVAVDSTHTHLFVTQDDAQGPVSSTLLLYVLNPTTPTIVPAPITAVADGAATGYIPQYDADYNDDPLYGPGSVVAHNNTNASNGLKRMFFQANGTLRRSATDTGRAPDGYIAIRRCYDYNSGNYLIVVAHGEGANLRVEIFNDDLTSSVASTLVMAGTTPASIGIIEDPSDSYNSGAANSAFRIWVEQAVTYGGGAPGAGGAYNRVKTQRRSFAACARVESVDETVDHWRILSRPFTHNGLAHIWLYFDSDDNQPRAGLWHWRKIDLADTVCYPETVCYWGIDTIEGPMQPTSVIPGTLFPSPPAANISQNGDGYNWGSFEAVRVLSVEGAGDITSKTALNNYVNWGGSHYKSANSGGIAILPGGAMKIFDGKCHDYGWAHAPEITGVIDGGAGNMGSGSAYYFTAIYEWTDGAGNLHRSAPADIVGYTPGVINRSVDIGAKPIFAGDWDKNFVGSHVKISFYRANPTTPNEFHLIATVDNAVPTAGEIVVTDGLADSVVDVQPLIYTYGGVLSNGTPPPTQVIHRHRDRLFAIDDEDPRRLVYTKPIENGVAPEWAPELVHIMPVQLTAIETLQNDLIVFGDSSVYTLRGDGIDIFGSAGAYIEELRLPSSGAVSQASVKNTNIGLLWYDGASINLINFQNITDIGSQVQDSIANKTIYRIDEDSGEKLIRILYNGGMLVYDYEHNRWSRLTFHGYTFDMVRRPSGDLYFWDDSVPTDTLYLENSGYVFRGSNTISFTLETPWVRLGNLTGYQRVFWVQLLGKWESPHSLQISVYIDYNGTNFETVTYDMAASTTPYQILFTPAIARCQSISFRISDTLQSGSKKSVTLTGIEIVAGFISPRLRNKNGV